MGPFVTVQIKADVSNFIVSHFFLIESVDAFKWRPRPNTSSASYFRT